MFVYDADQSVRMFEMSVEVLPMPGFAEQIQLTVGEIFGWLIE